MPATDFRPILIFYMILVRGRDFVVDTDEMYNISSSYNISTFIHHISNSIFNTFYKYNHYKYKNTTNNSEELCMRRSTNDILLLLCFVYTGCVESANACLICMIWRINWLIIIFSDLSTLLIIDCLFYASLNSFSCSRIIWTWVA